MRKLSWSIILVLIVQNLTTKSFAVEPTAPHVVVIGFDGWGAYSMLKSGMTITDSLMGVSSYTSEARCILPSSSACNWASMFMGAGIELHGYTTWNSKVPDLPSRVVDDYGYFPSVFSLLKNQKPDSRICIMYEWKGIGKLFPEEVFEYNVQFKNGDIPEKMTQQLEEIILKSQPDLLVAIYDRPDAEGHKYGHGSVEYVDKLKELDKYVGRVIDALKKAGTYDDTVLIITADHGGIDKGHGGKTMQEMQIPFIIHGKGIRKGHYIDSSVMIYDIAPTIAYILGLQVPQVWTGRPVTEAFE